MGLIISPCDITWRTSSNPIRTHGAYLPTPSRYMAHLLQPPQDMWPTTSKDLRIHSAYPTTPSGHMAHIFQPSQDTWRTSSNPIRTHGAYPPTPSGHMAHILLPPLVTRRNSSNPPPPLDVTGIYYICSTKQGAGASILADLGCGVARRGTGRAETLICN